MPQSTGTLLVNNFTQGLITEATAMNFPDKGTTETWNTRYTRTSAVERRLGYDFEAGYTETGAAFSGGVSKAFVWNGVGFEGRRVFIVVQTGSTLFFFESQPGGIVSTGKKSFSINLNAYLSGVSSVSAADKPVSMAYGLGKLFVCHPYCKPFYVVYDDSVDNIAVTTYTIQIRDFEGVDDLIAIDARPTALSNLHKYNLWNQGWWDRQVKGDDGTDTPTNIFRTAGKGYPNNCDVWWYYKSANDKGKEVMDPKNMVDTLDIGNSAAPRGHYIYDVTNVNRSATTGISGLPTKNSNNLMPGYVAFYAGRVWYGGINAPGYANRVYYTQIIERDTQIGDCYQMNDPTAEQLSDLLDSDGGDALIADMGSLSGFFVARNSLILFATNGVWTISGSGPEGTGFTATDFAISRLSNVGMMNNLSLVEAEGVPFWWNSDGIYTVAPGQSGGYEVNSLTDTTIKTFFQQIPQANRIHAQGAYNPVEKQVQWVFRSVEPVSTQDRFSYDSILELNLINGAFYPHRWNLNDQVFGGILCISNGGTDRVTYQERVTKNDDTTTVTSGGSTTIGSLTPASGAWMHVNLGNSFDAWRGTAKGWLNNTQVIPANGKEYILISDWLYGSADVYEVDETAKTMTLTDHIDIPELFLRLQLFGHDLTLISTFTFMALTVIEGGNWLHGWSWKELSYISGGTWVSTSHIFSAQIDTSGKIQITGSKRYDFRNYEVGHASNTYYTPGSGSSVLTSNALNAQTNTSPVGYIDTKGNMMIWPSMDSLIGGVGVINAIRTDSDAFSAKLSAKFGGALNEVASYRRSFSYYSFLPGSDNHTRVYVFLGPSDINAHVDNLGYNSATQNSWIDSLTSTYPTGIICYSDLGAVTAGTPPTVGSVVYVPLTLTDEDGNPYWPFPDTADNVTHLGAPNTKSYGDYFPKPAVQKRGSNWYVIFTRLFENNVYNSYVADSDTLAISTVRVFLWDPTTLTGRQIVKTTSSPFDWVTDTTPSAPADKFIAADILTWMSLINDGKMYTSTTLHKGTRNFWLNSNVGTLALSTTNEPVTVARFADTIATPTKFKYLSSIEDVVFLEENNTSYVDFLHRYYDEGGKDFTSTFTTGATIPGQGQQAGELGYVTVQANSVANGSAKMRSKWDWSNDSAGGKWSANQEVYSANRPYRDVSRKRLLVRGIGPAVQLQFTSVSGKPFSLIAWEMWFAIDTQP